MFLHLSVILFTDGGGSAHPLVSRPGGVCPTLPDADPTPPIRSTSCRYTSYWNAYLFIVISAAILKTLVTYVLLSRSGSEPSLGSRNENQVVGSDSASKRTLVSQENMSPSNRPDTATTATTTPTATHNVSDITHNATETTSILPTMNDLDPQRSPEVTTLNFDNSPAKTPSYLNASRLASGYSPYSSYTPVLQARNIKVLRKSESESDSSFSSTPRTDESRVTLQGQGHGEGQSDNQQQQQPITNGHVVRNDLDSEGGDLDLVDSAKISSSNVKVTSRTHPQRPLSGDLDGGISRSSHAEERLGLLENGGGSLGGVTGGGDDLQLNLPRDERLQETESPDTPAKVRATTSFIRPV